MKNIQRILRSFLMGVLVFCLSGCSGSPGYQMAEELTEAGVEYEGGESELASVNANNLAASVGDTILFLDEGKADCYINRQGKVAKLDLLKDSFVKKFFDLNVKKLELSYSEITASENYFYVSCKVENLNLYGTILLFVIDEKGSVVQAYQSPFLRIYANGNTIFGYYDEDISQAYTNNDFIEATHYIREEQLLKNAETDVSDWQELTGKEAVVEDVTLYQILYDEEDGNHETTYYSNEKPMDDLRIFSFFLVCDGTLSSYGQGWLETRPYLRQIQNIFGKRKKNAIFGKKKKNILIFGFQCDNTIYGVCNAYSDSGGMMQVFTKDYKKSFSFNLDADQIVMDQEYSDKELVYWDGKHLIYHTPEGLYYEEPGKKKETLIFESKYQLFIDIAHGIVVVHDGHSEKDDFVEGEPVAVKLWEE